jgi:putative MATE family efflux protein
MQAHSFKQINTLALPALIAGIAEPILSITDTAIIGNLTRNPTDALAAVGIVGTFLSMLIWVFGQTQSALAAIIAQYLGAGRIDAVKHLPAQAIMLALLLAIGIIISTYPFATQIFELYNAKERILDYSTIYYKIRILGFPFTLFTIAVFGTFRGLQNTKTPMYIAVFGALLNVLLDVVLVYGIPNYIAPMHIEGAAYASVFAQIAMALLAGYYLYKNTAIPLLPKLPLHKEVPRFLTMVANLFVRTLALNITLYFAVRFATSYGKNHIAAYTIAINLWFLCAFLIDGYATAGQILTGKLYGAKNHTTLTALNHKLLKIAITLGSLLAILGFIMYKPIGLLFVKAPEVLQQFYSIFWLVLIMQPLCAVAFIYDGVFKGLGKMKVLRNVLLVATFVIFIPAIYVLNHYKLELHGVFIALAFWMLARTAPLHMYFKAKVASNKDSI